MKTLKPTMRALTFAALIAAMATGCARMPMSTHIGAPAKRAGAVGAKAAPTSASATAVARKWDAQAIQVGTSVIRSEVGDDVATYIFMAPGKPGTMLLALATEAGLKAMESPVTSSAGEIFTHLAPFADVDAKLLDSKDLFRHAEAAGLENPHNMVVLGARNHASKLPVALVASQNNSYVLVDAATGKALSAVSRMGDRRVQAHELGLMVVIVGAVGTAAVWGAKKLIAKFWRPKPKPSPTPTPEPSAAPSAEPSEAPLTPPARGGIRVPLSR